jgi:sugar O-acyltransferase (sialic acid O-acetyltransferase NeuD family)
MPEPVIILGAVGNSLSLLEALEDINDANGAALFRCEGFLDDNPELWGTRVHGVEVLGPVDSAVHHPEAFFVNGIGSPLTFRFRSGIVARTGLPTERFTVLVHPTAHVSPRARLGPGCVVLANATVPAQCALGRHVMVLANATLGHDVVVGDHTCIAAGSCVNSRAEVGASCYVSGGASVREGVRIGDGSLVNTGSAVFRDVPGNTVVSGNPARCLRPVVEAERIRA